jgi:hypothetical protein
VQAVVIESFYPDPRFGRVVLQLVRSMRFTPTQDPGRDAGLVVIGLTAGDLLDEDTEKQGSLP